MGGFYRRIIIHQQKCRKKSAKPTFSKESEKLIVLNKINQHTNYKIADLVVISLCKLLKKIDYKKTKIKKTKKCQKL